MSLAKKIIRSIRNYKVRNERQRYTSEVKNAATCHGRLYVNGPGTIMDAANLVIEDNVHIGGGYLIHAKGGVRIGRNTHISRNLVCYACNHNYLGVCLPYDDTHIEQPVNIEKNVWIGMNVCITPGVTIGEGAIIGMGSVVTKDVPPLAIAAGNPARIIRYRDEVHYRKLEDQQRYGGVNGRPLQ